MINFGIVGFGLHAVKRLMPGFGLSKNCRVTALSRRALTEAQKSARQYHIPHAFSSTEELCRSSEVDAVLVTTPNSCHLADVLTAIACRKPVLCEKPMAMNSDECRQMVEAASEADVELGIAHVFRFNESVRAFKDAVAVGKIGKPVFARSQFSFVADENHPRAWINDPQVAGGGPIADVGVHCIDTLRFVLQDEIIGVSSSAVSDRRSGELEASATMNLEFSRGTLASVFVSFRAPYCTDLEIIGEDAAIRADDALNVEHPINIHLCRDGKVIETDTVSNRLVYAQQVDAFAAAVEGKSVFPISGEEGWKNQLVLDAAYRSIKAGHTENVEGIGSAPV